MDFVTDLLAGRLEIIFPGYFHDQQLLFLLVLSFSYVKIHVSLQRGLLLSESRLRLVYPGLHLMIVTFPSCMAGISQGFKGLGIVCMKVKV